MLKRPKPLTRRINGRTRPTARPRMAPIIFKALLAELCGRSSLRRPIKSHFRVVFSRLDRRNTPAEIALWFCESDALRVQ